MSEKKRFFADLSSLFSAEGKEISNVKFFPGEKISTPEKIYRQAAAALTQFKMGIAKAESHSNENLSQVTVDEFLSK